MILAIDDDPFRYDGLKRMLAPRGIEVRAACCAACVNDAVLRGVKAVLLDHSVPFWNSGWTPHMHGSPLSRPEDGWISKLWQWGVL